MSNHNGVYVSNSSVHRLVKSQGSSPTLRRRKLSRKQLNIDDNKSQWTFLERLLAIEEEHDKRRMKSFRNDTRGKISDADTMPLPADPISRWIHSQVLDDDEEVEDDVGVEDANFPPQDEHLAKLEHPTTQTTDNPDIQLPHISTTDNRQSEAAMTSSMTSLSHHSTTSLGQLSSSPQHKQEDATATATRAGSARIKRKRPLRLPPILLPRVYTITPRPLQPREFLTPTKVRGNITDSEWEDLKDCRYIRHPLPRFSLQLSHSNSSLCPF